MIEDLPSEEQWKTELDRAQEIIEQETSDLGEAVSLISDLIDYASTVPAEDKFANWTAALAAFTRGVHDLQAAVTLCSFHYYPQALSLLRSVHEAAGIGRTMAHSPRMAAQWMAGEWQSDHKSRQFVANVMQKDSSPAERSETVSAYEQTYSWLSEWAHVTKGSAAYEYLRDIPEGYAVRLHARFDEEYLRATLFYITGEALFFAYAVKNAAPGVEIFPSEWLEALDALGKRLAGDYAQSPVTDWEEHRREHEKLHANLRNNSELKSHLKRNPNAVENLLNGGKHDE
jgi:hypothetical protein